MGYSRPARKRKKGKNLGHGCLLFSEAGAWVYTVEDAIRNKYATRESERSRDRGKKRKVERLGLAGERPARQCLISRFACK